MAEPDDRGGAESAAGARRPGADQIDSPASVATSTARNARGRSVIVGWTADGRPAAATRADGLTDNAREVIEGYRVAGLPPRRIPYSSIVPVTYVLTGPAVDFADMHGRRAEDQVRYTVTDATGERREISIGERTVLGAIAEARVPWQAARSGSMVTHTASAVPLYTVFVPMPGGSAETGLAILFEPTIAGETNEPAFRSFVRNTIGGLLILDESQPPTSRKGYLEAAGRIAGAPAAGGSTGLLKWLRRAGLVDFDDGWLQSVQLGRKKVKGQAVRLLKAIGMVEVDERTLEELTHPRPDYDIDPLDTDVLLDLAERMYAVSRKLLG